MRLGDDGALARRQHEPRSIPLGQIWSALTSEVGDILTQGTDSTTDGSGPTTSPESITMITTKIPVPILTTTVDTTVVQTSFLTVRITTAVPTGAVPTTAIPDPHTHTTESPETGLTKQTSRTESPHHTSLPSVITREPSLSSTTSAIGAHQSGQSGDASSATTGSNISNNNGTQKHAIIGGLSGAIAGLVLIGVLIIFFLRKRRRRDEGNESRDSMSEKGFRPILARKWSELTTRKSVAGAGPVVSRGTTPDLDGGLIRVSMENWPRPFAHGESFRESMGPRRLQVTNPDPSRPETPLRRSSDTNITAGFFKQPRTALAAFLSANRSRANSATRTPSRDDNIPTIAIDAASSSERLTPPRPATPSFRSYPSVSSLPTVEQRPPEDPFLTPPDERDELSTPGSSSTPRRPGATPLQSAAGAASRTLSHLGSALNPFRSKSNRSASYRSQRSRQSVSTFFSSSSAGDPFQLDRPSVYEQSLRRAGSDSERPEVPRWAVYEGT